MILKKEVTCYILLDGFKPDYVKDTDFIKLNCIFIVRHCEPAGEAILHFCHSRESGNPVKILWTPNQVGNDDD